MLFIQCSACQQKEHVFDYPSSYLTECSELMETILMEISTIAAIKFDRLQLQHVARQ